MLFGLLRSVVGSGRLARTKYVLLHFRGAACPAMRAMRLTARRDEAKALLGGATVEFGCERRDGATVDALLAVLQRSCVSDDGTVPSLAAMKADLERQIEQAQAKMRAKRAQRGGTAGARPSPLPRAKVRQPVETAAFVATPPATPSSPGGNHWLLAAVHSPDDPLSRSACF